MRLIAAGTAVAATLWACAAEEFAGASPEIVEDCRREVALLSDPDDLSTENDPFRGPSLESTPDPIEDAREAQEVSGGASLNEWPEQALMYRCLASRGVELTSDQAAVLAEWEKRLEPDARDR